MEYGPPCKPNPQVYEEACEWFLEFRTGEPDSAARSRFDAWLRRSPENVSAYLEATAIWNEPSAQDQVRRWGIETLIAEAVKDTENVVPFSDLSVPSLPASSASPETPLGTVSAAYHPAVQLPRSLAASVVFASLAAGAYLYGQRGLYSTGTGEQRSVTLADGSTVELNAQTKLRVRFTDTERGIELLAGQALFEVAKDKSRPFVVSSAEARVRAVGTQFDVYRRKSGVTVSVVEGRVVIAPLLASRADKRAIHQSDGADKSGVFQPTGVLLTAGEQAIVTARATIKPSKPNIAAATAWTQRRLVFEAATLTEVAEEFSRYNDRRLVIRSPELYDFHITGTFSSADPSSLLRFLQERSSIEIAESRDEIVISRRADAP